MRHALADVAVGGVTVARYVSGAGLDATLSPRPFLHPVRTLAGVTVSDREPADHRWHLGVGVAIQDVGGANLWGGRTYVRDTGYTWRDDHGTVTHRRFSRRSASGFAAELDWCGPGGRLLLVETREVDATPAGAGWRLALRFRLRNATGGPLAIGSPATNGRAGAGYGGFFWRFPPLAGARVRTAGADGEDAVHGSRAAWLAVSGRVPAGDSDRGSDGGSDGASDRASDGEPDGEPDGGPDGGPGGGAPVTVVLAGADDVTRADPWFVRLAGYPGAGLSLAPERPLVLPPGGHLAREVHAIVADGAPEPTAPAAELTSGTSEARR
jgi:hypothetical protein